MTTASTSDPLLLGQAHAPDGVRNVFVLLAMTLVTLAFGFGLHLQFGLAVWLAVILALVMHVALVSGHAVMRRAETVTNLRDAVRRLEGELAVLKRKPTPPAAHGSQPPLHQSDESTSLASEEQRPASAGGVSASGSFSAPSAAPHAAGPVCGVAPPGTPMVRPPLFNQSQPGHIEPGGLIREPARAPGLAADHRPVLRAGGDRVAVSEADVAQIHGAIKKLAEELRVSQSALPPEACDTAAPSAPSVGAAIAASAQALKRAAQTMRAAAGPVAAATHAANAGRENGTFVGNVQARPAPPSAAPAAARLSEIAGAVASASLDVYLEPILGLSDLQARHYEVSVRLRTQNGASMTSEEFTPVAQGTGLLPLIDALRVSRSAKLAVRMSDRGTAGSLFSQISGESLASDRFLREFADTYHQGEMLAQRLVLSFNQDDVRSFAASEWATLKELAELGFRFALEDVLDLDMDFEALTAAGFAFAKLEASVFLEGLPAQGGVIPAADLCHHLAGLGLTFIVGRIDDEAQLAKVLGFGVLFGQGMSFGAPRAVKSEILRPPQRDAA
jgi:cyclic-di-GMP phosphodiesterase, flagellum assembly factor TipF